MRGTPTNNFFKPIVLVTRKGEEGKILPLRLKKKKVLICCYFSVIFLFKSK